MKNLIDDIMELMCEDDLQLEKIINGLNVLNDNGYFQDLSKIRIIFFEIAADLNNKDINNLLNKYTNNNYSYLLDFIKNNDYSPGEFLYNLEGHDYLNFFLTSPELNRKYNSKSYKIFKKNQDFLTKYPVKEFGYLYLNFYLNNFNGLTEDEIEFCEKFKQVSEIYQYKYKAQCKTDFLEMVKEKFANYFDNKDNNVLDKTFVRMYREENQAIIKPRKIKSLKISGKPSLESGTWASTLSSDYRYISKWDEWQSNNMDINYKFVATFNINKNCNVLQVANVNELAILYFLYPDPHYSISLDNMLDLYNCAEGNVKFSFTPCYINWEKVFEKYNVYYFANEASIGEGFEMSNPYDAETILIRDISLIENLKKYDINEYRKMFCIEDIER